MRPATLNYQAFIALVAVLAGSGALAQEAARVQSATGVLSVERPDGARQILSVGSEVRSGDVLRTERDSTVGLRFTDGTQVSLRPNTRIAIEGYSYEVEKPAGDNFAMRLLKGGMRTVTGLLGKRRPEAFAVRAVTATVGIRGTDFVVRVCEEDCAVEGNPNAPAAPGAAVDTVAARVVVLGGSLMAQARGQAPRSVALDGGVYPGETIGVSPSGIAVLVFRDDTRITLEPGAVLKVGLYEYDAKKPAQGLAELQLVVGSAQVWTGRIAKVRPDRFRFVAADAPVHVFGTGFSISLGGVTVSGNADSGGVSGGVSGDGGSVSGSASVSSDGANASGSASGGGTTVSGSASANSGGASGSGSATSGGKTVSGQTSTSAVAAGVRNAASSANTVANKGVSGSATIGGVTVSGSANSSGAGASGSVNVAGRTLTSQASTTAIGAAAGNVATQVGNVVSGAAKDGVSGTVGGVTVNANAGATRLKVAPGSPAGNVLTTVRDTATQITNTAGVSGSATAGGVSGTVGGVTVNANAGSTTVQVAPGSPVGNVFATVRDIGTQAANTASQGVSGSATVGGVTVSGSANSSGAGVSGSANVAGRTFTSQASTTEIGAAVSSAATQAGNAGSNLAKGGVSATVGGVTVSGNAGGSTLKVAPGSPVGNVMTTVRDTATQVGAQGSAALTGAGSTVGNTVSGVVQGSIAGAQTGSGRPTNPTRLVGAVAGGVAGGVAGATGGDATQAGGQAGTQANATLTGAGTTVGNTVSGVVQGAISGQTGTPRGLNSPSRVVGMVAGGVAGGVAGATGGNATQAGEQAGAQANTTLKGAETTVGNTAQAGARVGETIGRAATQVIDDQIKDARLDSSSQASVDTGTPSSSGTRSYDLSGGVIANVVGLPDVTAPPARLQTIQGEPVVTVNGDRTTRVWTEQVVPGSVRTRDGGVVMTGTVLRTEVVGPEGTQTTVSFVNIEFFNPTTAMFVQSTPVQRGGGVLVSVRGGQGLVVVTNSPSPNPAPAQGATASSARPDDAVQVSASLGRGAEATTIAREATTARDFAMKTLRNPMPVTVGVWEGAVQLEGAGGSQMVRKGESAALPEGGGKPVPVEGFQRTGLSNPSLRPDRVNADLAQVFEEDGKNFTDPGVYVQVREGAVELKKDGEMIVLQRGDTGFTDSGSGPLRKFTTPPPFIVRDPFLARGVSRSIGSAGGGLMCAPASGT